MQISRKAEYALRAVTILASLGPEKTMQAHELAQAGKIPTKFLEQILLVLKRADILWSKRGVGGGYRLGRESRLISAADVIEAVDGELIVLHEMDDFPTFTGSTGIAEFLGNAESSVNEKLRQISIEDFIQYGEGDSMVGYGI
ncbi:MAG: Rrf2 family transcriptional regulator [Verrucomicrobiales bacterium]|jgi:Rrf2 family protein|nr:Rrf2 family transcriptional regulator [Verrucomicrobiales bacterium]